MRSAEALAGLPKGAKVVGAQGSGASYWTRTARLDAELADGSEKAFFLKVGSPIFLDQFTRWAKIIHLPNVGCSRRQWQSHDAW
jgi:hypothetical protein